MRLRTAVPLAFGSALLLGCWLLTSSASAQLGGGRAMGGGEGGFYEDQYAKRQAELEAARERQAKLNEEAAATPSTPSEQFRDLFAFVKHSNAREKIEHQLSATSEFEFVEVSLLEALDFLSDLHNITILIDETGLEDVGLATDTTVTLQVSDITLRSALGLLLDNAGDGELGYLIKHDVLQVTNSFEAESHLEPIVYRTRQLKMDPVLIADVLQETISGPWFDNDGEGGTIKTLPDLGGLVIRANQRQHHEIEKLLKEMLIYKQN